MDTILLDAGGVIVWPNWNRVADALRRHGVAVNAEALALGDPHARHVLDVAEVINSSTDQRRGVDFFNFVLMHAGVPLSEATAAALADLRAYHQVSNLWEHVPDFVVPTLSVLKSLGYRLAIVSNSNGTLRTALARLELASYFDVVVDSFEEGLEKPDPRIFNLALERMGAAAAEALHVGDMYHVDVVGARAAGISPVLVDEADLKTGADCPRIRSIAELPTMVGSRPSRS